MKIISETGTIVRALPNGMALDVKIRRQDGSALVLEIEGGRGDLVRAAREARMDAVDILVRYTTDGRIVGFGQVQAAAAA